jgi:hypothetical protein
MSLESQRQARGSRKKEGRQTYHMMASLERSVVLQLSLVHTMNQPGEDQTHVSSFVHDRRLHSKITSVSAFTHAKRLYISRVLDPPDTSHRIPCKEAHTPSSCGWSSRSVSCPLPI